MSEYKPDPSTSPRLLIVMMPAAPELLALTPPCGAELDALLQRVAEHCAKVNPPLSLEQVDQVEQALKPLVPLPLATPLSVS